MTHPSTDRRVGEGFAYFHWHRVAFRWSACKGVNDSTPGCGRDGCMLDWDLMRMPPVLRVLAQYPDFTIFQRQGCSLVAMLPDGTTQHVDVAGDPSG